MIRITNASAEDDLLRFARGRPSERQKIVAPGRQKNVACEKGGVRLYKPCTREIVRSAPKVASESKILARRDHLEQYVINSQISSKSQILYEFHEKITFPSLRPHDKNLDPARTFAVRRLRGSPLACTVARYLIRVLTGARRKRIGISLKKIIRRPKKSHISVNLFFANSVRVTKELGRARWTVNQGHRARGS